MGTLRLVTALLRQLLQSRAELVAENLVISEAHLRRVLREYSAYYHDSRLHQSLAGNAPRPHEIEPPSQGRIVAEPFCLRWPS